MSGGLRRGLLAAAKMAALGRTMPRGRYAVTGGEEVLHYFHPRINKVRKIVRRDLPAPPPEGTRVLRVPVRYVSAVDRNNYSGEALRRLRAERGVGKRKHREA